MNELNKQKNEQPCPRSHKWKNRIWKPVFPILDN